MAVSRKERLKKLNMNCVVEKGVVIPEAANNNA